MRKRKKEKKKNKKMRKWKMKRKGGEEQTKRKGNSVDKKGERRKEKKRRIERKTDKGREEERGRKENEIFPGMPTVGARWSEKKVDSRIISYVWVPKSWSFVKLHEVGNFPT